MPRASVRHSEFERCACSPCKHGFTHMVPPEVAVGVFAFDLMQLNGEVGLDPVHGPCAY
jgi:hypothetical protein